MRNPGQRMERQPGFAWLADLAGSKGNEGALPDARSAIQPQTGGRNRACLSTHPRQASGEITRGNHFPRCV